MKKYHNLTVVEKACALLLHNDDPEKFDALFLSAMFGIKESSMRSQLNPRYKKIRYKQNRDRPRK